MPPRKPDTAGVAFIIVSSSQLVSLSDGIYISPIRSAPAIITLPGAATTPRRPLFHRQERHSSTAPTAAESPGHWPAVLQRSDGWQQVAPLPSGVNKRAHGLERYATPLDVSGRHTFKARCSRLLQSMRRRSRLPLLGRFLSRRSDGGEGVSDQITAFTTATSNIRANDKQASKSARVAKREAIALRHSVVATERQRARRLREAEKEQHRRELRDARRSWVISRRQKRLVERKARSIAVQARVRKEFQRYLSTPPGKVSQSVVISQRHNF